MRKACLRESCAHEEVCQRGNGAVVDVVSVGKHGAKQDLQAEVKRAQVVKGVAGSSEGRMHCTIDMMGSGVVEIQHQIGLEVSSREWHAQHRQASNSKPTAA